MLQQSEQESVILSVGVIVVIVLVLVWRQCCREKVQPRGICYTGSGCNKSLCDFPFWTGKGGYEPVSGAPDEFISRSLSNHEVP